MTRAASPPDPPDRLTAVLEELEAVRRSPGWTPTQESLVDRRGPSVLRRRGSAGPEAPGGRHRAGAGSRPIRPHTPLVRPPTTLRGAQVTPSRLAVVGTVALVLAAVLVFGGRVLLARASAAPRPVGSAATTQAVVARSTGAAPFGTPRAPATPTASRSPALVIVDVVGQVHHPSVVRLRAGARVKDAVAAAGGALRTAELSLLNLARVVTDGEQIRVPKPGETVTPPPVAAPHGASGGAGAAQVVDLNAADQQALEALPGVGPVLAGRIIDWRTRNGRFTSVDELGEVSGIGDKMMQRLRPHVRV